MEDGVKPLLGAPIQDVLLLDLLREASDVLAALDLTARLQVVEVEHGVVLHAPMPQAERNAGAILGGGPHHVGKQLGDVYGASLLLGCCFGPLRALTNLAHPFEVGQGALFLGLERCPLLQGLDDIPCRPYRAGYMHKGLVADDGGEVVDLSEELRLYLLDMLLVPDV